MANQIKSLFPIFQKYPELVYFDNASTTQRPQSVIDTINNFNSFQNANIHRGIYELSSSATKHYGETRDHVASFLGSKNPDTIGFTKGTTESINVVAKSFVEKRLQKGDNIVVTIMEHHANFIPWQMLAKSKSAELRIAPIDKNGNLDYLQFEKLLDSKTRIVACNHISNTIGTINDVNLLIDAAHKKNIPVIVDAAQSAALYELDVNQMGCDFLVFSGHKMFGPFGTGVLYAAEKWIEEIGPYNYGGGMIENVSVEETTFRKYPYNLEAGTSNVSGVLGLDSAIEFVKNLERKSMVSHQNDLTNYCKEQLQSINEIRLVGDPDHQAGIISFLVKDIHPHDVATFLDKDNIAVRAGMHCTQPLLDHLGTPATVRVSFSIYNEMNEVDKLIESLKSLIKFWS